MGLKERLAVLSDQARQHRKPEFWVQTPTGDYQPMRGGESLTPAELAERKQDPALFVMSFDLAPGWRDDH